MEHEYINRIIQSYENVLIRSYAYGRFGVLRQRFLNEIGQYLPESGEVLDIGCGFGLFALYYAHLHPKLFLHGLDINPKRVALAERSCQRLGLTNVRFEVGDASAFTSERKYAAVYMLDIVHHIPPSCVRPLFEQLLQVVSPEGRVVVKDVDTSPSYKRWFTHALDWMMAPFNQVQYWSSADLRSLLVTVGFQVYVHSMVDWLPYPHVLYICNPRQSGPKR